MKNKQFILLLVISVTILLHACKKDTGIYPMTLEERIKNSSGMVTATLNGKPWTATLTNANYWQGGVSIVAEYYLNEYLHETLSISKINQLLKYNGVYYSHPYVKGYEDSTQSLFSISEDDATVASYFPDTAANNYIEILNYNADTREIKGIFQISFYLENSVDKGVYDAVRFTDGAFSLKIK